MGSEHLGPWEPLSVAETVALFQPAAFRWWLSGGHALEAHFGERWRSHDDTDVGIVRQEAEGLLDVLRGWDVQIGAAGVLSPWDGRLLDPDRSENNLWCRPSPTSPWAIDVTVGDGTDQEWVFRRDPSVRRPWREAVLVTDDGIAYLAPEIQMLFKAKTIRPKDEVDAATVIPRLEPVRRSWLHEHLPSDHPWQKFCNARP